MIKVYYRKKGIKIAQIWYPESEDLGKIKADIAFVHGVEKKEGSHILSKEFHSMLTDLTLSEEELTGRINKTERYQIRRSKKEDVEFRSFTPAQLIEDDTVLTPFIKMYEQMYKDKGMKVVLSRKQLDAYIKANAFYLTGVFRGEEPLAFHSYVADDREARLFHSTSNFRSEEADAAFIARANKRLHMDDMMYFKNLGLKTYDWGGISDFENPNGIDVFKMKFGGEKVTYYNLYMGCSLLGKLAILVLKRKG